MKLKRKQDLELLYYRYKDTTYFAIGVSVFLLLIAVVLIGKVIVPQLQNWFSIREEVSATRERINVLQQNQSYITSVNSLELENNFKIAASALPFEKDFIGVLNAINASTVASGAILDDYSFQVGNLSTKSAQLQKENSIPVELNMKGSLDVIETFLDEMYKKVPLSEVVSVDYNEDNATLELLFYYKILPGQAKVSYIKPLLPLSAANANLLRDLETWKESTDSVASFDSGALSGTTSGTLTPF